MSKLLRKNSHNSAFFWRKLAGKKEQKISQHAFHVNGAPSKKAKTSTFASFLYRQDSKTNPSPSKKPQNMKFLYSRTNRKNFQPLKIWKMIDREHVEVFIQKSAKSDQWMQRKLHETQRDVTDGEKALFDVSSSK